MGRGEKEREGKPERGKGEGGSAPLKIPRAPPPFPGRVVPRISALSIKSKNKKNAKLNINLHELHSVYRS